MDHGIGREMRLEERLGRRAADWGADELMKEFIAGLARDGRAR
jgi:hypothetical protein